MAVYTLYFGGSIPERGDLTDTEWRGFLAATIAAEFPDGYTVWDAQGGWRDPATRVAVREPTKVMLVALPDTAESLARVNRVRAAYQRAFRQQLVGMTINSSCAAF